MEDPFAIAIATTNLVLFNLTLEREVYPSKKLVDKVTRRPSLVQSPGNVFGHKVFTGSCGKQTFSKQIDSVDKAFTYPANHGG